MDGTDGTAVAISVGYGHLLAIQAVAQPGDANGDGMVDGADYTIWADHFGITDAAGALEGDFNGDGIVGDADCEIWADNCGAGMERGGRASHLPQSPPAGSGSSASS